MSQSSPVINRLCSTPKLEKKADQITPEMKYLELSGIAMENSGRQAEQMNEKSFGSLDAEQQFSNKNSDSYPYCKVSEKRQKAFILAVRKLFGSIGRVMMAAVLHKNIIIPSPNNPHIIPPFWTPPEDVKVRGEEILAAEVTNRAIHQALWSTKTAAQALAIAGYWFDLTAFAQELGDARISLVASLIATSDFTGKDRRNLGPESLHPASLMKSCLLGVNPHQEINSSVFYSCHELFQLASMTRINILPEIMLHCLKKIKEKVNCLDLKVQRDIYLPAPPVFCPQLFGDDIVKNNESRQISRSDELQLRNEISGWVRLFSTIISASGIAQPLLQESCKYKANEEVEIKQYHELLSLADYLGPVESGIDMTDVSEWPRIFQMWAEFLKQLWILQIRDKLWLCVRKYTISSSQHKKKNFHEKKVLEILLLCEKLYRLAESNNWKEEIVALTLTLAGNAPPCTAVAETLARIIMQPSKLPSLVKDRANRLFEQWKNIVVDIPDFADKKANAKKKLFAANIRSDLYRIFENACTTALQSNNFTSSEENEQSNSLCSEYTVTTLFESPNEDFRKLLTLYANMTFRKDAENFPHHCTQVPNVPEFSEVIRRRELQSLSLKKILLWIEGNDTSPDYTAFELSDKIVSGDMKEKKGFFRNMGMCQRNSKTTILIRSKESTKSLSRSRSLSPDYRQTMGYNNDYSISRELCTDRCPQKYHRKSRNSKQNSVNRNRHRSLSLRKKQHNASLCKRSNSLCTLDTKDSSNSRLCENISSEVPLNLFLSLNQHLLYSLENKDNMMNLLHWILRRERKFCLSSSANEDEKCMLLKKVDLSIQDLVLAYAWEFIKETTTLRIDNAESVRLPIRKTNQSKIKKIPKIKSKHKMSVGDSQEDNRHTHSSKKLIPQKEVNQESHSGHDKGHTLPLLLSDEDLKVNHENETVNASHSSNTGDKNERENQDIKTDDVPVGASNVSCTENIQNKTSVIIKDEETHTQSSDEIQHEEEMNLPGEIDQPIDSNVDDGSFSALDGSNIHELRYHIDNTLDATKEHNNLADLIKQDEVKVADNKERKPISQKKKYCDVVDASTQYSVPLSENSWQPFRPKSRMSKKPPPPRLVIEAEKTGTMKQEKQTTFIKTKSLTPIETPSEIFESPFHGVPKLLQHEFEKQDNSKVLSLSDLKSDNDNTCVSQSIAMPNDNTLDDVTLPDSLHVSDLEEDLQYTSSIRRNEIEKLDRESAPNKERKINPTKLNQDHSKQADRATSIQVRPIFIQSGHMQITNKKDDQPKNTSGHTQVLKLLTLPKAQPSEHNEVTTEQYQPLMLKKIPFQFLQNKHLPKNTIQTTEHQSRNVNGQKHLKTVNFESGLPNDIGYERITLLKVPLFAPTQRAVQEKKQLKLLDPQKVFSFPDGKLKSKKLTQLIVPLKSLKGMPHKTTKIEIPESEEKDKENTNYIVPDKTTKSVLRLHNENPKRLFADKECETEDISVPSVPSCKIDKACQHSIPRPHVNTIETQTLNDFQNELTNIPKVQCPVQIVNVDALKEIDQCKVKTNQIYNNDRAIQNQGYQVRISEPSEEKNPSETNVKIQDKRKLEVETMVSEQGISQDDRKLSGQNQEPSGITIQIQKEMKNSNTQTQEAYPTTNTEKGVQTHTNVSAVSTVSAHQQTHSIMPSVFPTGRSNQMALMLNPPVLNMDKPKHEPRYSKGANVLTEVDIPCDVVQGRLNAIGDKLDQTIYSEELKLATENNSKVEDAINDRHPKFNETITKSDSENQGRFIQRLDDIPHNTQVELSTVLESNSVEIQHDGHSNVQRESVEGNSGLSDIPKSIPNRKQEATLSFDDMLPSNLAGTSIEDPIQAFCEAKITFEELCKYSTQIISLEKHSEKENHVQSIQALEREAEETLQELHQSKHFMSKINVLVKTAEEVESHRSMMCASDKQNRIGAQSTKNQEWQTTKTLLHETGNSDILLKYIEDAQPKDLTFEVIDDIIKYAGLEEGQKKKSSIETPLLETYTLQNLTNIDDSNLNCNHLSHDRGADKKNQMFSEEHSPKGSPVFHLDLTSLRSDSRNTCVPQHSGKKDHLSALSYEEETLEKRRKIRRWMIEQRQKRRAQTQEVLERNELRGRNLTRVSKNPLPAASARSSLSGRELREHSREREERRSEQRKQFQQKREEEAERLLQDHEEELLTHRELIKKRRSSLGTMGRSMPTLHGNNTKSKVKKLAQGNNTIRIPSSGTKRTAELASLPRGSVSNRKSSHYKRVSGVKQNITLENDKKIQEGIDGLREYIRPTKSTDHSMQVSEDEYKLTYRKTGDNGNQKVNRGIPGKQLGRNGSFSLSLDRISEVDSASSPSLNNGDHLHHVEGDANGEDTSGDISWNVPDEIKMLLYK